MKMQSSSYGISRWLLVGWLAMFSHPIGRAADSEYFGIRVVDSGSGRGVPLVVLTTVNDIAYVTDSAGWIAFREPGLMDTEVFFAVTSHGYKVAEDGFGYRGKTLRTAPGRSATIEITRRNLAERMYRITGQGIYRDSVLLGKEVPLAGAINHGGVLGQDTVQARVYRGKVHWFWGDTDRASYPLGNFRTSGATSLLPGKGGLDPSVGIDLAYELDDAGFCRPLVPGKQPGAVWLHGLCIVHQQQQERLVAHYARVKSLGQRFEHGLVLFNDEKQTFEKLVAFDKDAPLFPRGQSLFNENGESEYLYFCTPFPTVRVKATLQDLRDPTQYEAYTCLKQGASFQLDPPAIERDDLGKWTVTDEDLEEWQADKKPQIDRDENGLVMWSWKRNTGALDAFALWHLVQKGYLNSSDNRLKLINPADDSPVYLHAGSVHWNDYRRRWVMVGEEIFGDSSFLGEVWYAEAESLQGPWGNARHIVTHDRYSFYNPVHHQFFDEEGGRFIYFEGTYSDTFSKAPSRTPRYDYNQIMYRLDLADDKLDLPPPPSP